MTAKLTDEEIRRRYDATVRLLAQMIVSTKALEKKQTTAQPEN